MLEITLLMYMSPLAKERNYYKMSSSVILFKEVSTKG